MPTYLNLTEIKPGDLFYGLNRERELMLEFLDQKKLPNTFLTIDEINLQSQSADKKSFQDFDDFKQEMGFEKSRNNYWRSECKIGVLWAKKNNCKIYFVIDGITYQNMLKEKVRSSSDWSCTESEIAFIYKYYQYLSDNIIFCSFEPQNSDKNKIKIVNPPWENDEENNQQWNNWLKTNFRTYKLAAFSNEVISNIMGKQAITTSDKISSAFFQTFKERKTLYKPIIEKKLEYFFLESLEIITQQKNIKHIYSSTSLEYIEKLRHTIQEMHDYPIKPLDDKIQEIFKNLYQLTDTYIEQIKTRSSNLDDNKCFIFANRLLKAFEIKENNFSINIKTMEWDLFFTLSNGQLVDRKMLIWGGIIPTNSSPQSQQQMTP